MAMYYDFPTHAFFDAKNTGPSKKLVGNIVIVSLFVDDSVSQFTQQAKDNYIIELGKAINFLESEAKARGIKLKITCAYGNNKTNINCNHTNTCSYIDDIFDDYGKDTSAQMQEYYRTQYKFDEAPILFVFNKKGRSFAIESEKVSPSENECSNIFCESNPNIFFSILHELLHQFGAKDYYYPQGIKTVASKVFPKSIMLGTGYEIDSLTAYLIGWRQILDTNAVKFLDSTRQYDSKTLIQSICDEWKRT